VVDRNITRRALLAGGLGTLAYPAYVRPAAALTGPRSIDVTASRINSFLRTSSTKRLGRLEFRGGLTLTSQVKAFGGLSGLIVESGTNRLLSISDEGHCFAGTLNYEGSAPAGITSARMGELLALNGRALTRKRDSDAEGLTLLDGNLTRGTALVSFERNHRIGRYPIVDGLLQAPAGLMKLPADSRRMSPNKGLEVLTVMSGGPHRGSPVAMSERLLTPEGHHTGWIFGKGEPQRFHITDIGEFDLTGAASLPDGSLLLLERRFRWLEGVKMRLRLFKPSDLVQGAVMAGETLIQADLTAEIDNMEGIAVHRDTRGATVITLVSDDNYNATLQRTILLQFALDPAGAVAAPN
jgi:hypothetical protein